MEVTDIQFKDNLRKELIMLNHFKKLAESGKTEELIAAINEQIERVNASLQD